MRQAVGTFLILMAAVTVESAWIWIPWTLAAAGIFLTAKKMAPSRRQAKDDAHKKYNQMDYNTRGREIANAKKI